MRKRRVVFRHDVVDLAVLDRGHLGKGRTRHQLLDEDIGALQWLRYEYHVGTNRSNRLDTHLQVSLDPRIGCRIDAARLLDDSTLRRVGTCRKCRGEFRHRKHAGLIAVGQPIGHDLHSRLDVFDERQGFSFGADHVTDQQDVRHVPERRVFQRRPGDRKSCTIQQRNRIGVREPRRNNHVGLKCHNFLGVEPDHVVAGRKPGDVRLLLVNEKAVHRAESIKVHQRRKYLRVSQRQRMDLCRKRIDDDQAFRRLDGAGPAEIRRIDYFGNVGEP